ncbi:hypothetical protein EDB92DRAFT_2111751 [Lactarius akahatsu]|uniref:Uncharacterized protein n=1 Tax=Lactarius akahatsu TaxID=416441 RepID=A0AAD4LQN9_9AGAM|nr:hypothetical protein EDB92DRAFT_2111751 [Lactarius akahatsu]
MKNSTVSDSKSLPGQKCTLFLGVLSWPTQVDERALACSRRDDLESAALLLIHMLTLGGLSWTRNGVPRDDDRLMREKQGEKRAALPEDPARGLLEEFEGFLRGEGRLSIGKIIINIGSVDYCRREPQLSRKNRYAYWRERFRDLAKDLGYKAIDRFIWPPPPVPLAASSFWHSDDHERSDGEEQQPSKSRSHLNQRTEAQLKLAEAQLTGLDNYKSRGTISDAQYSPGQAEVVVISSGESSGEYGPVHRHNEAARITKLTQAADNRTLTREGFGFLDALHKQLADPSVFIVPLRSSKTRSSQSQRDQESEPQAAEDAPHERRSRLNGLCASLEKAQDNKTVAGWWLNLGR